MNHEELEEALREIIARLLERVSKRNKKIVDLKRTIKSLKEELGECRKL